MRNHMLLKLQLTAVVLLLASRTSYLRTDVVSFHEGKLPQGDSIRVAAADPSKARLFAGRVQSRGQQSQLPDIMPYLITAMFSNFHGESGVTKVVTIEMNE